MEIKMKFKVLACTALLAALSVSAYAGTEAKDMKEIAPAPQCAPADDGFYVGVYGGANFSQDYGNGHSEYSFPGIGGVAVVSHSTNSDRLGGVGGIKAGYKFQSTDIGDGFALQPAVELDALYLGTSAHLHSTGNSAAFGASSTLSTSDLDSGAFFVNGILNLKTPSIVTPYIGAGIGGEYLSASNVKLNNTILGGVPTPTVSSSYSDDTFAFAVEAIAGVNINIASHWDLFTEYKFVAAIDPSFTYNNVYVAGDSLKFNPDFIGQHLITAGIKYNF